MNIIITADLHIDRYKKFNLSPTYRDDQFIKLAYRFIEEGRKRQSTILFIAGDILNNSINPPETLNLLNKFFEILLSHFTKIYYILGNHDSNKKDNQDMNLYTYLPLFDSDKIIYMNDKFLTLSNRIIYFRDYQYSNKISSKPCDVFISHVTVDNRFGQEVDNSNFKLGLFGDIHAPIQKDNYYTISTPLQRGFHDYEIGLFGVLNLEQLTYQRVATESENYKFLKIRKSTDPNIAVDENTVIVPIHENTPVDIKINNQSYNLNTNNSSIMELIDNSIESKYQQIHMELKKRLSSQPVDEDINFDFKLKSIKIRNFRSIQDISYNFESKDNIYFIKGANGSGKSSFLKAIYLSLYSDRELKANKKLNSTDPVSTDITFEYENKEYRIYRSEGVLKIYENKKDITPAGKLNTEKYLYKLFPFMNLIHLFYLQGGSSFFNTINDIESFNKLFNISYLNNFSKLSSDYYKEISTKLSTLYNKQSEFTGYIASYNDQLIEINNNLKNYNNLETIENLEEKINSVRWQLYNIKRIEDELSIIHAKLACISPIEGLTELNQLHDAIELYNRLTHEKTILNSLTSTQVLVKCPNCDYKLEYDKSKIHSIDSKLAEIGNINKIKENYKILSECEKKDELEQNLLHTNKTELHDQLTLWTSLQSKYQELEKLKKDKVEISEKVIKYSKIKEEVGCELKEVESLLETITEYKLLFNFDTNNSIPQKVFEYLSTVISDDQLKFSTYYYRNKLQIECFIKVENEWIAYDNASSGQKSLIDMVLILKFNKLLGKIGCLFLDETMSHVDQTNYEELIGMLKDLNVNDIFITSHLDKFSTYTKLIEFSLVNNTTEIL